MEPPDYREILSVSARLPGKLPRREGRVAVVRGIIAEIHSGNGPAGGQLDFLSEISFLVFARLRLI